MNARNTPAAKRSDDAPLPMNLSMFAANPNGTLDTSTGFGREGVGLWVAPGEHAGVFAVRYGNGSWYDVQVFPRLLCMCGTLQRFPGICVHLAAAMTVAGSPLIDAITRHHVVREIEERGFHPQNAPGKADRAEYADPVMLLLAPAATRSDWTNAVREHPEDWGIMRILLLIPEAIQDPEIDAALLLAAWISGEPTTLERWRQHSPDADFPRLFRAISASHPEEATRILASRGFRNKIARLQPSDLQIGLRSTDPTVRKAVREALPHIAQKRGVSL